MKTLCHSLSLLLLAITPACPLNAQLGTTLEADDARGRSQENVAKPENNILLYEGPLVHDQEWVMRYGTTNTQVLGVFGGNCSMISSNVRNVRGFEQVRFEAAYQGLGVWKMAHVDTVVGNAIAATGQRFRYTYYLRRSYTGITSDGKAPNPNRAMPTATSPGFLEVVPPNVIAASFKFEDIFLLLDDETSRLVANNHLLASFHWRSDPAEQPPPFFPFVLDGYILTDYKQLSGQAGCDPL
jgi:hypothetical protein